MDARYLSETEMAGRVVMRRVTTRNGDSKLRWRVVGYVDRHSIRAPIRTGQVGNRFVVLERLDTCSKSEPKGTRKCISKHALGWMLKHYQLEDPC